MKNVISFPNPPAHSNAQALRSGIQNAPSTPTEQAQEVQSRLPEKPNFPPQSAVASVQISAKGRELLSRLAERTEKEFFHEPPQDTIEELVAEGIEEGFFD